MSNQQSTMPPTEEPTQEAMPWQNAFYNALLDIFPNLEFARIQQKDNPSNNIVSWMYGNERFFFSWYEIPPDELQFIRDNQPGFRAVTDEPLDESVLDDTK